MFRRKEKAQTEEHSDAASAKGNGYNFIIVFFVALGSFTYGYNSAIIGSVFGLPSFFEYFNIVLTGPHGKEGNQVIGATNGLFAGGGVIGALLVPSFLNRLGRKTTIQMICVLCIVSAAIQGGAVHVAMFLVGRFLNGIGVGMIQVSVPIYQSELSPAKQRGRMVGAHGILVVSGYGLASWTGLGCYFVSDPNIQWRLCMSLQVTAPLLLIIGSPFLPESPRWLLAHRKDQQALSILQRLHTRPNDPTGIAAKEEYYQIRKQIELENAKGITNLWHMIKTPSYRKRILAGLLVQCAAQSTGVLVVNNYQVLLYNNLGLSGWLPLLLYSFYNSWAAFMNWVNSMFLDRVGRVRILTFGLSGCIVMMIFETAMVAEFAGSPNRGGNAAGVLFLFLFVTFYAGCLDASSYVYCAEIFPTGVRAQGLGTSIAGLFASTLLYTEAAPVAFANVGWKYYLVFIIVPAVGVIFFPKYLPETRQLSLEEIAAKFGDEVAVDLSHLSEEQRRALDESLLVAGVDQAATPPSEVEGKEMITTQEKV
ncbi:general substrate transporter [Rhizodiscina lignyota]|uniref:General substrate transporter n=1 Tax=Rhizodiscina lignyota TaxID=1504668 RepID=A0A9P4IIG0_9PEZI|nr:general substrate transporter [Rhizodiscina lignyota]